MKRALPNESKISDKGRVKRPELEASAQPQPQPQPIENTSVVTDRRRSAKGQKPLTPEQEREMRALRERMKRDVAAFKKEIVYSHKYGDDTYQYRHITLPQQLVRYLPDPKLEILLQEHEYRRLGIEISAGWEHYMIYQPEPNILLLRRTHELARELKAQLDAHNAEEAKKAELKKQQQQQQPGNNTTESSVATHSSIAKRTRSKPNVTTSTTTAPPKNQQQA